MEKVVGNNGLLRCERCGEIIEKIVNNPLLNGTVGIKCRCEREEESAYEKRMLFEESYREICNLRQLSLMDRKIKDIRFKSCKVTEENRKALGIAHKYVDKFDVMYEKSQGLLFWGDVGTGKSYIAAAIANELIDRMIPVIMTSFIKLLDDIESSDKDDCKCIEKLNNAKVLVLDDLGAERGTDYALEKIYHIIDSRYRNRQPVIITTNLTMAEMQSCEDIRYNRIYDRIFEMCYPIKLSGMSWRKKDAMDRFDGMKKLLEE